MSRRVVITGLGLVCGVGNTAPEVWQNLMAAASGAAPIQGFDTTGFSVTFACEVKNFDPLNFVDKKEARKMGRFIHFAFAAAQEAIAQSGLQITPDIADRVGCFIGSGIGGFEIIEREHTALMQGGPRKLSPFFIPATIINMAAGQLSIRYGTRGPISATATACATSANSIGDSVRMIMHGDADAMIAGGSEAAVTPLSVGGFASMRALSTRNDEPQKASRPFDKDRDGFVMGDGAACVILEEWEHAKARGATIYAEMVGYGMTADAYHITAPSPDGEGAQRAMQLCMQDGGIKPEQVGYINAHGTSTPHGDAAETNAVKGVFGPQAKNLIFGSTKSMTGHLLGAAGALEFAACALAIKHGVVPPTINQFTPDPACDLNSAPNHAVKRQLDAALSNSFGFGGHNVTLGLKRAES